MIAGIAVLGKDNNPLYIRAFGAHDALRFHFIVHTALDFVEEKGLLPRPVPQSQAQCRRFLPCARAARARSCTRKNIMAHQPWRRVFCMAACLLGLTRLHLTRFLPRNPRSRSATAADDTAAGISVVGRPIKARLLPRPSLPD